MDGFSWEVLVAINCCIFHALLQPKSVKIGLFPDPDGRFPDCDGRFPDPDGRFPDPDGPFPNPDGRYPNPNGLFPNPNGPFPNPNPNGQFPEKTWTSQIDSHRNSVQNAPIGEFTALTATIFVTISVFMSQGNF